MAQFATNMLLMIFAIIFGISQSSDDCFYHPGHAGKRCVGNNNKYTCCPPDHRCDQGKCIALNSKAPENDIPIHNYVIIGVGMSVFAVVCIIIGAVYWHRRQMNKTEKPFNPLASFSESTNGISQSTNSVGYRKRPSKTQPTLSVSSVNIKMPPTTI